MPIGVYVRTEQAKINMGKAQSIAKLGKKYAEKDWSECKHSAKHRKIRELYGKADCCESETCTGKYKRFEWSNVDHKYSSTERKFWRKLCRGCHKIYDSRVIGSNKQVSHKPVNGGDRSMLINRKAVKELTLKKAEEKFPKKYSRVNPEYFAKIEKGIDAMIDEHLATMGDTGKTIKA